MSTTYPFTPEPLPYEYTALEPYIDEKTLYYHHDKHYMTYVDNLNAALEKYPDYQSWSLERLLEQLDQLPADLKTEIRKNGGGTYNHQIYFNSMAPNCKISECIERSITDTFQSLEQWQDRMTKAALSVFGSGYAVLVADKEKKLQIVTTANQDTPLHLGLKPLLLVDVWEHAYYLKYQNRRNDYLQSWTKIINWDYIESQYLEE